MKRLLIALAFGVAAAVVYHLMRPEMTLGMAFRAFLNSITAHNSVRSIFPYSFWRIFDQNFMTFLFALVAVGAFFGAKWTRMMAKTVTVIFAILSIMLILITPLGGIERLLGSPASEPWMLLLGPLGDNPQRLLILPLTIGLITLAWYMPSSGAKENLFYTAAFSLTLIFGIYYLGNASYLASGAVRLTYNVLNGDLLDLARNFVYMAIPVLWVLYGVILIALALFMLHRNPRSVEFLNLATAIYLAAMLLGHTLVPIFRPSMIEEWISNPQSAIPYIKGVGLTMYSRYLIHILFFGAMQVYLRGPYKRIAVR